MLCLAYYLRFSLRALWLMFFSNSSSFFFIPSPPENPPSVPAELITRCQGMTIGTGLAPIAWPTALEAREFLIRLAIHAYDLVPP